MKTHYAYTKHYIGGSDVARLIICDAVDTKRLNFGSDGSYFAYFVDGDCLIPDNYRLVYESPKSELMDTVWVKIYDDDGLTQTLEGQKIKIYRSGDFGCIIQIIK